MCTSLASKYGDNRILKKMCVLVPREAKRPEEEIYEGLATAFEQFLQLPAIYHHWRELRTTQHLQTLALCRVADLTLVTLAEGASLQQPLTSRVLFLTEEKDVKRVLGYKPAADPVVFIWSVPELPEFLRAAVLAPSTAPPVTERKETKYEVLLYKAAVDDYTARLRDEVEQEPQKRISGLELVPPASGGESEWWGRAEGGRFYNLFVQTRAGHEPFYRHQGWSIHASGTWGIAGQRMTGNLAQVGESQYKALQEELPERLPYGLNYVLTGDQVQAIEAHVWNLWPWVNLNTSIWRVQWHPPNLVVVYDSIPLPASKVFVPTERFSLGWLDAFLNADIYWDGTSSLDLLKEESETFMTVLRIFSLWQLEMHMRLHGFLVMADGDGVVQEFKGFSKLRESPVLLKKLESLIMNHSRPDNNIYNRIEERHRASFLLKE